MTTPPISAESLCELCKGVGWLSGELNFRVTCAICGGRGKRTAAGANYDAARAQPAKDAAEDAVWALVESWRSQLQRQPRNIVDLTTRESLKYCADELEAALGAEKEG